MKEQDWVSDIRQSHIVLTDSGVDALAKTLEHPGISWGVKGLCAFLHNEPDPIACSKLERWGDGSGHDQDSFSAIRDALAIGLIKEVPPSRDGVTE